MKARLFIVKSSIVITFICCSWTRLSAYAIQVTWELNPESDIKHYTIYRASSVNSETEIAQVPASESAYIDHNIILNTMYYYRIVAVDSAENVSEFSDTAQILADSRSSFDDTTPVELASFTVQYAPNSVCNALLLHWQTASETNNLGFDVERAIGVELNWKKIGFLRGYGTTTEAQHYEFIDEEATTEGTYFYRLKQNDAKGAFDYSATVRFDVSAPKECALAQNFPNPFNPSTQIVFQLKEDCQAKLYVYDMLGRQATKVVDQPLLAGTHKVSFDATDLTAGPYFYILQAGAFQEMKRMTFIK
ncbi:T9SS type A sorting domain-containing protein [candidate division KSB1 bacterium]|nr:T9SS type A sorting domain-containing protein [candidate division KSB1 bacterium]RQW01844.1 MAG: T9SS C-terminal target domain-containing protein [candidate division KSB1 bacterium]